MERLNELWLLAWERDCWGVCGAVQLGMIIPCLSQPVQYGQCNGAVRHLAWNEQEGVLFHTAWNTAQEPIAIWCVRCKKQTCVERIGWIWRRKAIKNKLWHRAASATCLLGRSAVVSGAFYVPCFLAVASADSHCQRPATGTNGPLVWPKWLKIFMLTSVLLVTWS